MHGIEQNQDFPPVPEVHLLPELSLKYVFIDKFMIQLSAKFL